jgi:hypothetical protein
MSVLFVIIPSDAVADAVKNYNLIVDTNAVYVRWGDTTKLLDKLRKDIAIAALVPVGVGFVFMLWLSIAGPY